jgi:hypothetical protein
MSRTMSRRLHYPRRSGWRVRILDVIHLAAQLRGFASVG